MSATTRLKQPLLYALIASVTAGALLGIVLVLRNTWGWLEVRVMLTTIVIAVASICGLACDLSRTPSGGNLLPKAGLAMTLLTTILILAGIWVEIDSEGYWKCTAVVGTLGAATVHVCLLSIAKLSGNFRWVFFITCQVVYGLALLICSIILFEIQSEALWRFLAAHSIVVAALTLVVPILHRICKNRSANADLLMPVAERNVDAIDRRIGQLEKQIRELRQIRDQVVSGVPAHRQV